MVRYPRFVQTVWKKQCRICSPWAASLFLDSPDIREIINTYLNDYLSSDRGLSVEGATLVILMFGAGNFLGTLISGIGSSIYEFYGSRYQAILLVAAIAGCIPFWGMINFNFDPID